MYTGQNRHYLHLPLSHPSKHLDHHQWWLHLYNVVVFLVLVILIIDQNGERPLGDLIHLMTVHRHHGETIEIVIWTDFNQIMIIVENETETATTILRAMHATQIDKSLSKSNNEILKLKLILILEIIILTTVAQTTKAHSIEGATTAGEIATEEIWIESLVMILVDQARDSLLFT